MIIFNVDRRKLQQTTCYQLDQNLYPVFAYENSAQDLAYEIPNADQF